MTKPNFIKRKLRSKQTRQKIFDTSLELFNKYGYENVSIDRICQKVGMSKGAFYGHFKSKDQIILEDFLQLNIYYDEYYKKIENIEFTLGKLFLFQQNALKLVEEIGHKAIKIVYHVEMAPNKRKKSFLISKEHSLYKITKALIKEGQKKGFVRKDKTADSITDFLLQMYRGMILDWCLGNGSYSLSDAISKALPLMYAGIKLEN